MTEAQAAIAEQRDLARINEDRAQEAMWAGDGNAEEYWLYLADRARAAALRYEREGA